MRTPAGLPRADSQHPVRIREDRGVRFHVSADAPRESQRFHSFVVGRRLVAIGVRRAGRQRPAFPRFDGPIAFLDEDGAKQRPALELAAVERTEISDQGARISFLPASTCRAGLVDGGRDDRLDQTSSQSLQQITEIDRTIQADDSPVRPQGRPRAHERRQRRARSFSRSPRAGLACSMTTAAGSPNSRTMRAAISRSSRFVYEELFLEERIVALPCAALYPAAGRPVCTPVPRGTLMRILAVAQVSNFLKRAVDAWLERIRCSTLEAIALESDCRQARRDRRVRTSAVWAKALHINS